MKGAKQALLALLAAESALAHCSELTVQQQDSGSEQADALAKVREALAEQFKASPYQRLADGGIEMRMPVFGKATILRPPPVAHDALQAADPAAQTAAELAAVKAELADVKADFARRSENRVVISRKLYAELLARSAQPAQGEAEFTALDWPADVRFRVIDDPDPHKPCWLVMPDGCMLGFNHHATNGVDQARAQFVSDACNAALAAQGKSERSNRQFLTPDWIAAEDAAGGVMAAGALATPEHPAQGDPAAWRAGACFFNFEADAHEFVKNTLSSYPVDPLYTAPPAPVVPDGWELAMRQLVYYARTSGATAGQDPILMEACEACKKLLADAPEVPRG